MTALHVANWRRLGGESSSSGSAKQRAPTGPLARHKEEPAGVRGVHPSESTGASAARQAADGGRNLSNSFGSFAMILSEDIE